MIDSPSAAAENRALLKQVRILVVVLIFVVCARLAQEQFVSSSLENSVDATKQTLDAAIAAGSGEQDPQLALAFQAIFVAADRVCDLNPSPECDELRAAIDSLPAENGP